jgi:hypothetical protein
MSITTAGSITLEIQQQPFTLEGLIGESINVQYHKSPEDGLQLGTVQDLAREIAGLFGVGDDFTTKLNEMTDQLKAVSEDLAGIVKTLMEAKIIITDLGINTAAPATYQFGFYVRLKDAKLGPVTIVGFGVVFTYEKESGNGEVKTIATV